jgi:hypothetical protein
MTKTEAWTDFKETRLEEVRDREEERSREVWQNGVPAGSTRDWEARYAAWVAHLHTLHERGQVSDRALLWSPPRQLIPKRHADRLRFRYQSEHYQFGVW